MGDVHDASYYAKCMVGGIFACGITHAAVCPLDIVKCRRQASPKLYTSLGDGFRKIHAAEGMKGFTLVSFTLSNHAWLGGYIKAPWRTPPSDMGP